VKSHDLAQALNQLAKALRTGPNVEIADLDLNFTNPKGKMDNLSVAVGLDTLVGLSKIDKRQWIALIEEFQIPVSVDPRDSTRNILGRVLSYLEKNQDARKMLQENIKEKSAKTSPELAKALATLLRD
jgi:hypothetical protein